MHQIEQEFGKPNPNTEELSPLCIPDRQMAVQSYS
jgi:hypothetical protein